MLRRVFPYIMAFAGLLAALYAASGLLALLAATAILRSGTLIGAGDMRNQASFYLAALIVGAPLWAFFWLPAQRRARGSREERDAGERRLFLAAIFTVTSVVALYALHTLLHALLTLPGPAAARPSALDGFDAAARLLVYGSAWLAYARLGWRERSPRAADRAHDLAVYVLAGFALTFLATGLLAAGRELVGDLLGTAQPALLAAPASVTWIIWGSIAAWTLSGSLVWGATWCYDLARGSRRTLRVLYLYLVLSVAAPAALGTGTDLLYELLRRLFGYHDVADNWAFLRNALPLLVVAGAVWAYHWLVMRRQAALDATTADDAERTGIAWPRRPAIALLAGLGLVMLTPALISVLWLGLDAWLDTRGALSGPDWWRDRLSVSLAAGLVGLATWLGAWHILQRAARAHPAPERTAPERRLLLGAVELISALSAAGFTIAVLWLSLRTLLGAASDPSLLDDGLKDGSAAVVLAALAVYYALVLRRDLRFGAAGSGRPHVIALAFPGAEAALADLRRSTGLRIDVIGQIYPDATATGVGLGALHQALVGQTGHERTRGEKVLLILRPDGSNLYTYTKEPARQALVQAQERERLTNASGGAV